MMPLLPIGNIENREAEFWSMVDRDPEGCWNWKGWAPQDYGRFLTPGGRGKFILAHRVAYHLANGPIPYGKLVCHDCDNPLCCRPSHLYAGTQKDNVRDMWSRGRACVENLRLPKPHGESHPRTQLSDQDIRDIRLLKQQGLTAKTIGEHYGLGVQGVYSICWRRTWKHIDG